MFVGAYAIIVALTWALVIMNVRAVVTQFLKDRNVLRLYSYLTTLLIMGSLMIGVASAVVQRVIDSEVFLQSDMMVPVQRYRK